jgi:hypothetical protein
MRRQGPGEAASGVWSTRTRRVERGGGIGGRTSKEVVGWARRWRQRPSEQGRGGGGGVCTRNLAVRENGGGRDRKTEEGTCRFSNSTIFVG